MEGLLMRSSNKIISFGKMGHNYPTFYTIFHLKGNLHICKCWMQKNMRSMVMCVALGNFFWGRSVLHVIVVCYDIQASLVDFDYWKIPWIRCPLEVYVVIADISIHFGSNCRFLWHLVQSSDHVYCPFVKTYIYLFFSLVMAYDCSLRPMVIL